MLRERGASGCVVFGEPDYYGRFGFKADPNLVLYAVFRKVLPGLVVRLRGRGDVTYRDAFSVWRSECESRGSPRHYCPTALPQSMAKLSSRGAPTGNGSSVYVGSLPYCCSAFCRRSPCRSTWVARGGHSSAVALHHGAGLEGASRLRGRLAIVAALGVLAYGLYTHPPFASVRQSEMLVRTNVLNGSAKAYAEGTVLLLPGIHQVRRYSTRDQLLRLSDSARATGKAPFQSNEGLSIGVDIAVRWAIDRERVAQLSKDFPDDLNADLVRPAVQGIVYPLLARHSVREIFSSQRALIQQQITVELGPKLASLGLRLRGVDMGQVDLPQDYRAGMEKLLAQELETEKIRYNLQLKEAQVKETELEGDADKVRKQKAAEAAAQQQVIAARAQEETMQHILPFKQKQIEQRRLEAEAEKVARIRTAEGRGRRRAH